MKSSISNIDRQAENVTCGGDQATAAFQQIGAGFTVDRQAFV
jgi:hypothetical protein